MSLSPDNTLTPSAPQDAIRAAEHQADTDPEHRRATDPAPLASTVMLIDLDASDADRAAAAMT